MIRSESGTHYVLHIHKYTRVECHVYQERSRIYYVVNVLTDKPTATPSRVLILLQTIAYNGTRDMSYRIRDIVVRRPWEDSYRYVPLLQERLQRGRHFIGQLLVIALRSQHIAKRTRRLCQESLLVLLLLRFHGWGRRGYD